MGKLIYFYNIGIYKNNELTKVKFIDFIDDINQNIWKNQVRKIEDEIVAIFPMYFNERYKDKRIIPFGKFRLDYKPFTGQIESPQYKEIKEQVLEMVTLVYDARYETIAMDFNIYGAKKKLIEQYFTSFLPQLDNDIWEVRMQEIIATFDQEELKDSNQIRDIEIALNFSKSQERYVKDGITVRNRYLTTCFENLKEMSDYSSANIVRLEIGAIENKKSSINKEVLMFILSALNLESDFIENVKIRYRNNKQKIDTVDLKNINKILKIRILDNILDKNPAPEFIGNTVIENFENYSGTLLKSYTEFIKDRGRIYDIPQLFKEPREANRI